MAGFSDIEAYRFLKVEEYFDHFQEWSVLGNVTGYTFEDNHIVRLIFDLDHGKKCCLQLQMPSKNTIRIRFNPDRTSYPDINGRAIVQDKFSDLIRLLAKKEKFDFETQVNGQQIFVQTKGSDGKPATRILIGMKPFSIEVYQFSETTNEPFLVWRTAETPIYFTPNGDHDYAIIQAVEKPATARYMGFGEQGGASLCRNGQQSTYFNFDNMRYRQVYNRGPLDSREPLYHSDPFFMEFNGVPSENSANGIFIDNLGQILVDTGYLNSSRYLFGTRFGDLDFYLFTGKNPAEILGSFTDLVGKPRLKPRYCLGYHQGCYGYDSRGSLEWVVQKYRDYGIPLDGLHVDVDIQDNYHTFTINESRFPNPQEMFTNLRKSGVKCSTNITPIISNQNTTNYSTYQEASQQGYFIADKRYDPDNPASRCYQLYGGGNEYQPNDADHIDDYNTGNPYIGEVYYGNDASGNELGTTGHYADLGRFDVRKWWGKQYQYLFDMGLEMVWQDMTTPAIRDFRGDMKGFPFRLILTDNSQSRKETQQTPVIKIWNLYSYNLHKATYHGLNHLEGRNNKRNFIIGRGCFTGSQRFARLWTGDNSSDWDFLRINISQTLSLGMCGLDINGQDIGGFECGMDGGQWASPELLIRWTLAGAFLPWFRNHYVRKGRKEFQEPFMYVEWFNQYRGGVLPEPADLYRMVLPACRYYIQLRYRLLQMFYDAMFANTINGFPICRPLFMNDPQDKALYNDKQEFLDSEFFVGKDFLVAPVLVPQSENMNNGNRDVYLPAGSNWYCFANNTMHLSSAVEGGTTIRDFNANLNLCDNHIQFLVPIYVREGAIIPTIELESYVGQRHEQGIENPITLNLYPGSSGSYTMYLDDGVSRSSASRSGNPPFDGGDEQANNEYREVLITHSQTGKSRSITIKRIHDGYTPKETFFFVAILHDPAETRTATGCLKSVSLNQQGLTEITGGSVDQRSSELSNSSENSWYYNENINISFIKVFDKASEIMINLEYN